MMDKKTLKALKGSIKKWDRIANKDGADEAENNCPLCKLFLRDDCLGCPVRKRKRRKNCEGTPYRKWVEHHGGDDRYIPHWRASVGDSLTAYKIAIAEKEFLESLLP